MNGDRKGNWRLGLSLAALALYGLLALVLAAKPAPEKKWFRGNTHTHTLWSDGDGAPEEVAEWYKTHGYQFLVLSDHNIIADVEKWCSVSDEKGSRLTTERLDRLIAKYGSKVEVREKEGGKQMRLKRLDEIRAALEEEGKFLFIKGEEITDVFIAKAPGTGKATSFPIHHNSINHENLIKPPGGTSVADCLDRTVQAVEAEAAKCGRPVLVHLNHPNFGWGVSVDDIVKARSERYFEVYNGHRGVRNYGDATHLSVERIWDTVLTARLAKTGGDVLYALATDDAHHYHKEQAVANPGRGWIVVRAESLSPDAIVAAMRAGDFYASSGVLLNDVQSDSHSLTIKIAAQPEVTYTTRFIGTRVRGDEAGEPGVILAECDGPTPAYAFKGDELYVRATIVSSRPHPNGYSQGDLESAWVQPVVVHRLTK
jgi:hypothetical protein